MDNFLENLRSTIGQIQDKAREVAKQELPYIKGEQAMNGSKILVPDEREAIARKHTLYDDPWKNHLITLDIAENYEGLINVLKDFEKAVSPKDKIQVVENSRKKFADTDGLRTWFDSLDQYARAADMGLFEMTEDDVSNFVGSQHEWTNKAYDKYFGKKRLV